MEILDYITRGGKNVIINYIEGLSAPQKLVAYQIRKDITNEGMIAFEKLNTRQLRGKLWEIKFSNQRVMYIIRDSDTVYFLHMCKKEKGKAKKEDLETAINRAKELGYRF